ncbi:MAG: amino acid adenylation domain-containing protein, partial [Psychrosphaera sp.]|nr:amino acid adenylation domain-containing protein [Psychrosphaera sp.]
LGYEVPAKFELTLNIAESEQGLSLNFEYNVDLFRQDTIEMMGQHLCTLIRAILQQPQTPIDQLTLLDHEQRQQLQYAFNDTRQERIGSAQAEKDSVVTLFERQCQQTPDNIAVSCEQLSLSYDQLNRQANQLAHYLKRQGVTANTLVGVCVERSCQMMVAVLAVMKAGGAYLPLDPDTPNQRLQYIVEDAAMTLLLSDSPLLTGQVNNIVLAEHSVTAEADTNPANSATLAYVIYTSGSTGQPKGVEIEHRQLMHYLEHALSHYAKNVEGGVVSTSLGFDATVTTLFTPLLLGKQVILMPQQDPQLLHLKNLIENADKPLLFKLTPAHLQALAPQLADFSSELAHQLVIGGEQLSGALLMPWLTKYLPNAQFINEYGPTEATVGCTTHVVNAQNCERWAHSSVPIGKPITNTRLYVLDKTLALTPIGLTGQLYIGGDGLARGYLKRPELTAERFITTLFGERLYNTGDLVRWQQDGQLMFVGRTDEQVKIRGFRVELGEIESQLLSHPEVQSCAVLGEESATGHKKLTAYVVSDCQHLRQHLQQLLPQHMVPGSFVSVDALPLTANGKLDKIALSALASKVRSEVFVNPKTQIEHRLTVIWADVLGIEPEQVSAGANFFALGGDSISSIQVVARGQQSGLHFTVKQLFAAQSIGELALSGRHQNALSAPQQPVDGTQLLLPIQWDFFADETQLNHYNQSVML